MMALRYKTKHFVLLFSVIFFQNRIEKRIDEELKIETGIGIVNCYQCPSLLLILLSTHFASSCHQSNIEGII